MSTNRHVPSTNTGQFYNAKLSQRCLETMRQREWLSILNGTAAQLDYTVPFTPVHAGKYRTEDTLNIKKIQKLNTTQKNANNTKHSRTKLAWLSHRLWHSARKQGGYILQRSRAHKGQRMKQNHVAEPRWVNPSYYRPFWKQSNLTANLTTVQTAQPIQPITWLIQIKQSTDNNNDLRRGSVSLQYTSKYM